MQWLMMLLLGMTSLLAKEHVIYGVDSRIDIYKVKDARVKKNSLSVAARFYKDDVLFSSNNTAKILNIRSLSSKDFGNICSFEKYASQPAISDCTGFMIADDIMLTAAHCIQEKEGTVHLENTPLCKDSLWVFNYEYSKKEKINLTAIPAKNIYECSRVLYGHLDYQKDFAIIKLKRKVAHTYITKLSYDFNYLNKTELYNISHPSGLPKKYIKGAKILKTSENFFMANVDTYGGSSGSPIFSKKNHDVLGLLFAGKQDYVYNVTKGCFESNKCNNQGQNCTDDSEEGRQELILKSEVIIDQLYQLSL
ncbi:MAG: serine protease [Bacteriovoracaceae bacterium]|jgi:V8-like Glu-specific endopeptidase|nr:serine protease [Bacteriovoracaceae bacterium]